MTRDDSLVVTCEQKNHSSKFNMALTASDEENKNFFRFSRGGSLAIHLCKNGFLTIQKRGSILEDFQLLNVKIVTQNSPTVIDRHIL